MNKIKKILLVATEYAPGMIPFAATIINSLANCKYFDVHAITVNSGEKTYKNVLKNRSRVTFIKYPDSKTKKLIYKFYPFEIVNTIEELDHQHNFDIIHLLTGDFSLALYLNLKGRDKRWFYTVHDLHPHEVKCNSITDKILHKCIVWGYKICRDFIDNLTTSSEQQLEELKNYYDKKKIMLTPFPTLVTDSIISGDVIPSEIEGVNDYILFFGSVNVYKGIDLLLDSFHEIEKKCDNTKLVIAGKGIDYIHDNPNVIRINRFIDDSEIKTLFERAKFVVYPYRSATMSGVFSLAFYFKKKILASALPFFKQYECDNIVYFENASDLKDKMIHMISDFHWNYEEDSYCRFYGEKNLINSYCNLYFG